MSRVLPQLDGPLVRLTRELRRTLAAGPAAAARVYLCGGLANPHLAARLEEALGLPVQCDGWKNILCAAPAGPFKLAVGLAIA